MMHLHLDQNANPHVRPEVQEAMEPFLGGVARFMELSAGQVRFLSTRIISKLVEDKRASLLKNWSANLEVNHKGKVASIPEAKTKLKGRI